MHHSSRLTPLIAALALSACGPSLGPAGPQGPAGLQGAEGPKGPPGPGLTLAPRLSQQVVLSPPDGGMAERTTLTSLTITSPGTYLYFVKIQGGPSGSCGWTHERGEKVIVNLWGALDATNVISEFDAFPSELQTGDRLLVWCTPAMSDLLITVVTYAIVKTG